MKMNPNPPSISSPERIDHSEGVYALRNPLTGNWLCQGQKGGGAYYYSDKSAAKAMLNKIANYNATYSQL